MLAVKFLQEVNGVWSDILPLFSACHISAWVEAMDKNKYLKFDPPAWVVFASQILDLNCTSTLVQNLVQKGIYFIVSSTCFERLLNKTAEKKMFGIKF